MANWRQKGKLTLSGKIIAHTLSETTKYTKMLLADMDETTLSEQENSEEQKRATTMRKNIF